jgi:hypothetical protein
MDTLIHPDYMGIGSETNLVRLTAPAALYAAEVQAANDAATDIHAVDPAAKLFTTVQVEVAWGKLGTSSTAYVGIAQDRAGLLLRRHARDSPRILISVASRTRKTFRSTITRASSKARRFPRW